MKLNDAFRTAYEGISSAKVRTILTMLGIVIGIASVMILMSLGASAKALIVDQVQGVGSNLIFVVPGASKGSKLAAPQSSQGIIIKTLLPADVNALRQEPSIKRLAPDVRGGARVVFENKDTTITYQGSTPEFFGIRNLTTASGATFTSEDVTGGSRVAVIGSQLAIDLFGARQPVGKIIRIKDISFRVVGVLEPKGVGAFGIDQDSLVIVPITVAQKQLLGIDYYNSLSIEAQPQYSIDYVKERITKIIRFSHRITNPDKDDFTIRTQADILSLLGNITSVMTAFLSAIASISLIVGGIGIMNIMLVSVLERTKEIGLRKALGAKNAEIILQFLLESVMLTFVGGIIGTIGGGLLSFLISLAIKSFAQPGWVFQMPMSALVLSATVSTVTGIIFGLYPARQAAKRSPVEALRYE
jgi:putative ABC transport system permease protein